MSKSKAIVNNLQAVAKVSPVDAEQAKRQARQARITEFNKQAKQARDNEHNAKLEQLKQAKAEPNAVEKANADNESVRICTNEVLNGRSSQRYVLIAKSVPARLVGQSDDAFKSAVQASLKPLALAVWNSVSQRLGIEPLKKGASADDKKAYNKQKASVMKAFDNAKSLVTRLACNDTLDFAMQEIADTGANPRTVMEQVADYTKASPVVLSDADIADLGATELYQSVIKAMAMLASKVNDKAYAQLIRQASKAATAINTDE